MPMLRRVCVELVGYTGLVLVAVMAVLLAGQLAQVGDLLWRAGEGAPWAAVIGRGGVVLLEAALPLAGLLAAGLVYGRLRGEAGWLAQAALGAHPAMALAPAVALGAALGLVAMGLSHGVVPATVTALRGDLVAAAAAAIEVPDRALALPGGGVARREVDGAWWAALPSSGDAVPTLVRAEAARVDGGALVLREARLWSPRLRVTVGEARVEVGDGGLGRRLGMFGPPNATPTSALDEADPHHVFTAHRRSALPAMAPLWALLGALLGARLGGVVAVAGGAAGVGLGYWLLRTGELSARAGFMSPVLAAWAPALLLALALGWALCRDLSLARPR